MMLVSPLSTMTLIMFTRSLQCSASNRTTEILFVKCQNFKNRHIDIFQEGLQFS